MKTAIFAFIIVSHLSFTDSQNTDSLVFPAVIIIINRNFATISGKFDIVTCGTTPKFSHTWLNHLLRKQSNTTSIQLSSCDRESIKLNTSTLLIFESPDDFKEKAEKIDWQTNKYRRFRHLVYIKNATKDDVMSSIHDGFSIDNVAFLLNETENLIELATSYMFTANKCRENQVVTINRFQRNTMKWETDIFFPEKYRDMHSCELTILKDSSDNVVDIFEQIMRKLSDDLKFKFKWISVGGIEELEKAIEQNFCDFYKIQTSFSDHDFVHIFIGSE